MTILWQPERPRRLEPRFVQRVGAAYVRVMRGQRSPADLLVRWTDCGSQHLIEARAVPPGGAAA